MQQVKRMKRGKVTVYAISCYCSIYGLIRPESRAKEGRKKQLNRREQRKQRVKRSLFPLFPPVQIPHQKRNSRLTVNPWAQ
jgi:hypothetical protein